jgi:hypothetical protein
MRRYLADAPDADEPGDSDDFGDAVGIPHGGAWVRPAGEDMVRCREHDLRPDEH